MSRKENIGNQDEREKARTLSPAEKKRQEKFDSLSAELIQQGYSRVDLTVSIVKANIFAVLLLIPLAVIGVGGYLLRNGNLISSYRTGSFALMLIVFLVFIVVHELIHGASWALFTEHGFKDIEFGFMKQYMTPYCTCLVPLTKKQYIIGALMPLIVLGILPMALGILIGSLPLLLVGILMVDSAAGDIMIVWMILKYRSQAREIVYMDHPTQAGGVIFER